MANNDLAVRFTETNYATRNEVSKELKMSLIDNIWSNILSYRSFFNHYLTIKSIEKNALVICVTPTILSNINNLSSKIIRLTRDYSRLSPESGDLAHFEDKCMSLSLKELAKVYDLDADDIFLRELLHGEVKDIDPSRKILLNYANSIRFIKKKANSPIDGDFLGDLYQIFLDDFNLTAFYRTEEDKNPENRVLIDRIYSSAPVAYIESMMASLFNFIANSNLDGVIKALVTYYYVNYIKPFPKYSDEIALLLAKAVLAHCGADEFGAIVPLESLLSQDLGTISKIFVEVQKTNDVTYFVNYGLKVIDKECDQLLDILANNHVAEIRKDFYKEETAVEVPEEVKEEPAPVVEQAPAVEEVKAVVQETVAPAPVVQPKVVVEEKPIIKPVEKPVVRQEVKEEIAVSYIPPVLDEKAAYRLEVHLLELDPSMKKGEAHFYARHCTLGKRYTIQQYKKAIGCAYETARTSMDHLVAMGYYRKEMVKNKNVYTPIPRN